MSVLKTEACHNNNLCCVFPGTGSVLPHGNAGPFPVSIAGLAEGPARGPVLPGRGAGPSSGALHQCTVPNHWPRAPHRAWGGLPHMERCSWGMYPQGTPGLFLVWALEIRGFCVWGKNQASYTFLRNASRLWFPASISYFLFSLWTLLPCSVPNSYMGDHFVRRDYQSPG